MDAFWGEIANYNPGHLLVGEADVRGKSPGEHRVGNNADRMQQIETLRREVEKMQDSNARLRQAGARPKAQADEQFDQLISGSCRHVVPQSLKAHLASVGAESPLDLPEREYDLLQPLVDGHEITWKYKRKPYWCEAWPGYTLLISAGQPMGGGWEEIVSDNHHLYMNHKLKFVQMDDYGKFDAFRSEIDKPPPAPAPVPKPEPPEPIHHDIPAPPAVAKYNLKATARFESRHSDELSFEQGDEVPILGDAADPGWYRAVINGRIGLVPGTHFATNGNSAHRASTPPLPPAEFRSIGGDATAPVPMPSSPPAANPARTQSPIDYPMSQSPHPQPASPFSYPEASAPSVQAPTPVNNKAWPPPPPAGTKKIRSIHNYSAREADELGFAKFEELFVFPTPVEPGWYKGMRAINLEAGLIPETHINIADLAA